ncbi:hypothetical protein TCAL_16627 [Tigriopus californicus]|uniref:39S ribosomal protein L36, mitochondrial n=1 Tax=Tigriopus californicus TaxID=6832 RepID=A0A553NFM2_TIGCA|nr:hypothetical protein TCAL_16627 [Tigriopus californicus]
MSLILGWRLMSRSLTAPRLRPCLVPPPLVELPTAGLKYVPRPTLRCSDCWREVRDNVTYVHCTSQPRHEQATKPHLPAKAAKKVQIIMTHATQGASTKGNGKGRCKMLTQHLFRTAY